MTKPQLAIVWTVGSLLSALCFWGFGGCLILRPPSLIEKIQEEASYTGKSYLRLGGERNSPMLALGGPIVLVGACAYLATLRKRN